MKNEMKIIDDLIEFLQCEVCPSDSASTVIGSIIKFKENYAELKKVKDQFDQ